MIEGRNEARFKRAAALAAKYYKLRPAVLANAVLKRLSERMIIEREGLRVFVDPTSNLGWMINRYGTYEELTVSVFRKYLRPGDIVLDIGANEGFFAALASVLAGPSGRVIAVEPQSRLQDILAINLALNPGASSEIVAGVIDEVDGRDATINLFPFIISGASSLVSNVHLNTRTETVRTWTPQSIADHCKVERFDFVKIDVEGFEPEVIRSLEPFLARRAVRTLVLDYHHRILAKRGIDPASTHDLILSHGYEQRAGDPRSEYAVYELPEGHGELR